MSKYADILWGSSFGAITDDNMDEAIKQLEEISKDRLNSPWVKEYIENTTNHELGVRVSDWDPATSGTTAASKREIAQYEAYKKQLGNGWRWRKYNDYKNTDVITKWQNNHWTVKGTWKQVLRHLPRAVFHDSIDDPYIDTDALYYGMAKSRQNLIDKEMLVSWRNQAGRLDWGWTLDYLDQQKRYRCENWQALEDLFPNDVYAKVPFRKWSAYNSHKWNGGIDGTYHAGERNLIEFYANYSDETMRVRGNGVTEDLLKGFEYYNRYRTHYTQKMTNIQVQDTITLDNKGTLWLSPSIRYNRVRTHSNPTMAYIYAKEEGRPSTGMYEAITQNNHKTTWQLALKKQINDRLSLRTTGGTYYRMLNLYEIAGDGGGIMPASLNNEKQFAKPEEGKQYDISAIWDGPVLGARTGKIQVTYFYRNSTNLLQLYRWGLDYWSYTNTLNGHSRGVELQIDQSWKKWDFSAGGTYLKLDAMNQMPRSCTVRAELSLPSESDLYSGLGGVSPPGLSSGKCCDTVWAGELYRKNVYYAG